MVSCYCTFIIGSVRGGECNRGGVKELGEIESVCVSDRKEGCVCDR